MAWHRLGVLNDLLNPAYKDMLQMADARTSGTAVTRIFSILQVNNRNEDGFRLHEKAAPECAGLHEKRWWRHDTRRILWCGRRIFFIVDALFTRQKGYDIEISFPKEGIGSAAECIALVKGGAANPAAKQLIDWACSPAMQSLLAPAKINFLPAHPKVAPDPDLAAILKDDRQNHRNRRQMGGDNRKRIVDRWVAEVLNAS